MSLVDKFLEEHSYTITDAIKNYDLSLANFVLRQYWVEIRNNSMEMEIEELKTCIDLHKKAEILIEDIWETLARNKRDYKIK